MRLFLDTSVLLSASISAKGASREIFNRTTANRWVLITTGYTIGEVRQNLSVFPPSVAAAWETLRPTMLVMPDVLALDRPAVFAPAKDRPILFGALAWADVLLTLDQGDFGPLMEKSFYGLTVLTPGAFLERERAAGRLV